MWFVELPGILLSALGEERSGRRFWGGFVCFIGFFVCLFVFSLSLACTSVTGGGQDGIETRGGNLLTGLACLGLVTPVLGAVELRETW